MLPAEAVTMYLSYCDSRVSLHLCIRVTAVLADPCREFEFSLISGSNLEEMAMMQRLQVNAAIATMQLGYSGKLVVETTDLTAQAFKVGSQRLANPLIPLPPPLHMRCSVQP